MLNYLGFCNRENKDMPTKRNGPLKEGAAKGYETLRILRSGSPLSL